MTFCPSWEKKIIPKININMTNMLLAIVVEGDLKALFFNSYYTEV